MAQKRQSISALDVANYLIERAGKERRYMDPMTLQKMVYYSQCWHLAEHGTALFDDPIEAWTWGPVVRNVWKAYSGKRPILPDNQYYDELTEAQQCVVDSVWLAYRHLGAAQLSRKTHKETPWMKARRGLKDGERSDHEISQAVMRDFAEREIAEKSEWFESNWDDIAKIAS